MNRRRPSGRDSEPSPTERPEAFSSRLDEPRTAAIPDSLIDHDAIAYCEREADDGITLEEVRAATSSIKDSMSRVVEEERAERS